MSGLFDFSEKEYSVDDILINISSGGLFSSKKLVIIKNYFAVKKGALDEKLEKFLKKDSLPAGRQGCFLIEITRTNFGITGTSIII